MLHFKNDFLNQIPLNIYYLLIYSVTQEVYVQHSKLTIIKLFCAFFNKYVTANPFRNRLFQKGQTNSFICKGFQKIFRCMYRYLFNYISNNVKYISQRNWLVHATTIIMIQLTGPSFKAETMSLYESRCAIIFGCYLALKKRPSNKCTRG